MKLSLIALLGIVLLAPALAKADAASLHMLCSTKGPQKLATAEDITALEKDLHDQLHEGSEGNLTVPMHGTIKINSVPTPFTVTAGDLTDLCAVVHFTVVKPPAKK